MEISRPETVSIIVVTTCINLKVELHARECPATRDHELNCSYAKDYELHSSMGPVNYLRGTRCRVQYSAAELQNVPRAHLATVQAQAVPIYRPGTQGRSIIGNNVKLVNYYLFPIVLVVSNR